MAIKKPPSTNGASAATEERFAALPVCKGNAVERSSPDAALSNSAALPKQQKSFFRGVAVAIAIMIPIWAWLILKLVR